MASLVFRQVVETLRRMPERNWILTETRVFSANIIHELKANVTRQNLPFVHTTIPSVRPARPDSRFPHPSSQPKLMKTKVEVWRRADLWMEGWFSHKALDLVLE